MIADKKKVRGSNLPAFSQRVEERAPLSVLVSRQLRESIMTGEIPIGTELPGEKELGQRLGVSRATIREALRILQSQGLLTGGTTVSTQRPRVTDAHVLGSAASAMEQVLRLGQVPLGDLIELRVLIEGAAFEGAAVMRLPAALEEARLALEAMRSPEVDIESFRAADLRFHQSLVGAAGNASFPLIMGVLRGAISSHLGEALHRIKDANTAMSQLTKEHEDLFAAVSSGDGARARVLVAKHIRDFYQAQVSL